MEVAKQERTFADKLNHLIDTMGYRDGRQLSGPQIAAEISVQQKVPVSASYMWELRTGKVTNPRIDLVHALAAYFGVDPGYFLSRDQDEAHAARLDLIAAMRDNDVNNLAVRASGLSAGTLRRITEIIENARILEGLDEMPGPGQENQDSL